MWEEGQASGGQKGWTRVGPEERAECGTGPSLATAIRPQAAEETCPPCAQEPWDGGGCLCRGRGRVKEGDT